MKIVSLESVDSTQKYLKKLIQKDSSLSALAVVADMQTDGIGSRNNSWRGMRGNLFLSFSWKLYNLPDDLKIESASIYFSYLLKETLSELGSEVWLKWPNDFYIESSKIGGMITHVVGDILVCGVGINLLYAPEGFEKLDIEVQKEILLKKYFEKIEKKILWKQVFSKYELEFHKSKNYFTHNESMQIALNDATLSSDGSLLVNGKRVYSLR